MLIAILVLTLWFSAPCQSQVDMGDDCVSIPGHESIVYSSTGDINIGVITFGRDYSKERGCASTVSSSSFYQGSAAILYAVNEVNKNRNLLPNLTLGFVVVDDCFKGQVGMGGAMNFIQPGLCNVSTPEVTGVVGITTSSSAVVYGNFLNLFRVPMVGSVSSAESLSDKGSFKYFVRVIPSDFYQAKAMISIVLQFNWTYVSTIYSEGDYGVNGIRAVHSLAAKNDICIAYSEGIPVGSGPDTFENIAQGLLRKKEARVLLWFTQTADAAQLLQALKDAGAEGHFIILGSDAVAVGFDEGLEKVTAGGLFIQPIAVTVPEFRHFFSNMSVANNPDPWLKLLMTTRLGCSWNPNSENECDENLVIGETNLDVDSFIVPLVIDCVNALSKAIHNYLSEKCPNVFKDKTQLKDCLVREEVLPYLYGVSFKSTSGDIMRFDDKGDAEGKYQINQHKLTPDGKLQNILVGFWDKYTSSLNIFKDLYWSEGQLAGSKEGIPESVCSKPCKPGEFLVNLELKCCWECRKCRKNEIVIRNGTACEECDLLDWPHQEHFLTCDPIDPSFLQWTEPQTLACLILAAVGLAFSFLMVILFTKYQHQRLIKATSRELSMVTLSGVILSYVAAIVLLSKPNVVSCYSGRICYNLSFSIAYGPLVTKVTRIYRIFAAAKHGTKAPSFISNRSQILFSLFLILIQVILSIVSVSLYPPDVTLSMPLANEPFVEMLCFLPVEALTYSLTYNLVLMLACSFFAFKARRLPDNFNESKFIFVCVCTTLFLWMAFIPSYFSAFYASQKIVLLVSVLLFNSAVMLLCLYTPRIYAVMYLDEAKQGVSATATGEQVGSAKTTTMTT